MAPERDELERRRKKRAAQRKKQRMRQRRMQSRLIAAGVIMLLVVFLIALVARDVPPQEDPETGDAEQLMQTEAPTQERATRPPETPTTTIHIKAAGDLNITDKVVAAGETNYGDDYFDFTQVFMDVLPVLSDADLTMLNFEGNMIGPPYGTQSASAPQQLLEALDAAGVDILQVANSYSIYNGIIGLNQTLNNIRAAGIEPVGAFSTPQEFQSSKGYTICDVKGVKVAVVAFTKGMGSLGLPEGSEQCVNKLYVDYDTEYKKIDSDGIRSILRDVRSEKPDVTIAMLHWGAEYNDTVFSSQENIAELMFKEGVDIILGTHSHMLHRIDFDEANSTLVAYSLGDFLGDGSKGGTNYSVILDIQITKDNDLGTTRIDNFSVTPIYTLSEDEGGQRRVVRINEALDAYEVNFVDKVTKDAYESMVYSLERIEARLDPEAWEAKQKAAEEAQ